MPVFTRPAWGWIQPLLHDPDGHEIRFYTHQHHTHPSPDDVARVDDPVESSPRHAQALADGAS